MIEIKTLSLFQGNPQNNDQITNRFLGYISKSKTEEWNQKTWSVCNIFGITICSSATYYPEVSAHVPLKVATKSSKKAKNIPKL